MTCLPTIAVRRRRVSDRPWSRQGPRGRLRSFPSTCPSGRCGCTTPAKGGGRIGRNQTRNLGGEFAEPEEFAYCFNVRLTGTVGSTGYLSLFPGDEEWPGTSSINWDRQGQTIANNAFTWLSLVDGSINVRCGATTGGSTHFILDLVAIGFMMDVGALARAGMKTARVASRAPFAER